MNKTLKLNTIGAALRAVMQADQQVGKPSPARVSELEENGQTMVWNIGSFGKIGAEVQTFELGTKSKDNRFNWQAPIIFRDGRQPAWVDVVVRHQQPNGSQPPVRVLWARNCEPTDVTEGRIPPLRVALKWHDQTPEMENPLEADFDLTLIQQDGTLIVVEIAVVTRRGRFYLSLQEAYCGQVVRTTAAKATLLGIQYVPLESGTVATVVPLYPENDYPGADFMDAFRFMSKTVVKTAIMHGASVPRSLSEGVHTEWNPRLVNFPVKLAEKGWQPVTVGFWNNASGTGRLFTQDNEPVHCYFKQILDASGTPIWVNGFPTLTPMTMVAAKFESGPRGLKATAVKAIEKWAV